ncbi:hypothetical protein GCM10007390_09670 [Persicitalea jodogahamensis]|uniref:Secretion system C-terminal sorting domain-containing protein n=2 Tax=Persicitalea jodogahamensis TaxID=402147 RepID=A0A8J3D230_9BACT|nr:hypothetical protein GCM10007390_09670 [Persicitalea jodogahamensis]
MGLSSQLYAQTASPGTVSFTGDRYGARFRDFQPEGNGEIYTGKNNLDIEENRSGSFVFPYDNVPGTIPVNITYTPNNATLRACVFLEGGSGSNCLSDDELVPAGSYNAMQLNVSNLMGASATLQFNNVSINGIPLGNFQPAVGTQQNYIINGIDPGAGFTLTGDIVLTGTNHIGDANRVELTFGVGEEEQDVRCGNKNQNMLICYYGVTQCVSEKIAQRYLKLGATLGGCGTGRARIGVAESDKLPLQLALKAFPNPVQDAMTLEVLAPSAGPATFEVLDLTGRTRQSRSENLVEGLNEVGFRLGTLPTGMYLIRAVDALNRQGVVKVSKE